MWRRIRHGDHYSVWRWKSYWWRWLFFFLYCRNRLSMLEWKQFYSFFLCLSRHSSLSVTEEHQESRGSRSRHLLVYSLSSSPQHQPHEPQQLSHSQLRLHIFSLFDHLLWRRSLSQGWLHSWHGRQELQSDSYFQLLGHHQSCSYSLLLGCLLELWASHQLVLLLTCNFQDDLQVLVIRRTAFVRSESSLQNDRSRVALLFPTGLSLLLLLCQAISPLQFCEEHGVSHCPMVFVPRPEGRESLDSLHWESSNHSLFPWEQRHCHWCSLSCVDLADILGRILGG